MTDQIDEELEELLGEPEIKVDGDDTSWTSIDMYYKGFHVKKSIPQNVKFRDVIKSIEKAIELGFEPSWNTETNKKQDPIMKATESEDGVQRCPMHGDEMKQAKSGKWYHIDNSETNMCMGTNWFPLKKKD